MPPRTLERAPGSGVPPNVLNWLETQPGCGAALLTNRAVRNHLGRYSADAWPEARDHALELRLGAGRSEHALNLDRC